MYCQRSQLPGPAVTAGDRSSARLTRQGPAAAAEPQHHLRMHKYQFTSLPPCKLCSCSPGAVCINRQFCCCSRPPYSGMPGRPCHPLCVSLTCSNALSRYPQRSLPLSTLLPPLLLDCPLVLVVGILLPTWFAPLFPGEPASVKPDPDLDTPVCVPCPPLPALQGRPVLLPRGGLWPLPV